jgi:V/A-type H+-transporting ATPase subunit I
MEGSFSKVGAVGILLAGHTLNIVLALLAVFVHAIRLNILEYSGQLGMEWSGFKYEPFKGSN